MVDLQAHDVETQDCVTERLFITFNNYPNDILYLSGEDINAWY